MSTIIRADADAPIPAAADPVTFRHVEAWLARLLLKVMRIDVFDDVTTPDDRKQRLRAAIREWGPERRAGDARDGGQPMTFRQVFERLYGERL